jgi:YesN/AraC family two-component response regulator
MPAMTGLQLADAIKTEWPKLPIIIASGFAEMGTEARSRLPELSKPFTEADLAQAILKSTAKLRENGRVLKFPSFFKFLAT